MTPDIPPSKGASRRQFLQSATLTGGALVLAHAGIAKAAPGDEAGDEKAATEKNELEKGETEKGETVLKLSEHEALAKVGGFEIIEIAGDRVIVAHTEGGYVACSAVCPHKGCDVEYRAAQKDFYCPCHRSRFDETGKVLQGPARNDLTPFEADQALSIHSK